MRCRRVLSATSLILCLLAPAAFGQTRTEIRFPDLPGQKTLKCDFHTHTVFSDGLVWPTVRVDEAFREGLDVLVVSDHIEYQPHKQDIPTNHQRPHEIAAGYAADRDILLIRGAEITRDTPPGHFNAIFLDDVNPLDTPDFYDVFDAAAGQGAFTFWNHPGWKGEDVGQWGEAQQRLLDKKQLHGIEVCNGGKYFEYAHACVIERNLTLIANSDIHQPSLAEPWTAEEHRTLTLVFAKERSPDSVKEALFAGRTAMWWKNNLIGRESELGPLFGQFVKVAPAHHRSKDQAFVKVSNGSELDLNFERVGKGGPREFSVPAGKTAMVRFSPVDQADPKPMKYRVTNMLVGPKKPLEVELQIPRK